jgi:HlyD family secretion protein
MNNNRVLDISEISDSREVLTERPRRFLAWFAYILLALLAVALVWAFIGEIDYYVKAPGEVRPNDSISTIRSALTGKITESNLEEGRRVRRGDPLFSVDAQPQLETIAVLEVQYESAANEIENLELLRESILRGENLFDAGNPRQEDYYYKYQKYVTDSAASAEQVKNTNLDIARLRSDALVSKNASEERRIRAEAELGALRLLLSSMDSGVNMVPPESAEQYARYMDYELGLKRYGDAIDQKTAARDRAADLYEAGGASLKEKENAQFELDSVLLEFESYKNEARLSAAQGISNMEESVFDLEAAIKSADAVLSSASGRGYSEELVSEKGKLDMLSSISDALLSLQTNLSALQKDLNSLRLSAGEAGVLSPIDGVISVYTELAVGDYVQSGDEIAAVIPETGGESKVQLAVPNADIADIREGQEIHFRFAALPFDEYGELGGRVAKISADARRDNTGRSYYIVEAELDGKTLFDKKGGTAEVKVGMTAEARVITKSRRIIYWVLEKLNFID